MTTTNANANIMATPTLHQPTPTPTTWHRRHITVGPDRQHMTLLAAMAGGDNDDYDKLDGSNGNQ
jgi:hypothetical protein